MLVEEYTRLDGQNKGLKIAVNLSNLVGISPHYEAVKGKRELRKENCVMLLGNGMVVLVGKPYEDLLKKLQAAR